MPKTIQLAVPVEQAITYLCVAVIRQYNGSGSKTETKRRTLSLKKAIQENTSLNFHRGVLAALTVVSEVGQDTLYDDIVKSCGSKRLVEAAQGEEFDLAHLRSHGYVSRRKGG